MNDESKEIILHQIRLARTLFLKHKDKEEYTETNAWYYLGVFDALFGIYFEDEDAGFIYNEDENLTEYLIRILQEFFQQIN